MNYEYFSRLQIDTQAGQPLANEQDQEYWTRVRAIPVLSPLATRLLIREAQLRMATEENFEEPTSEENVSEAGSTGNEALDLLWLSNLTMVPNIASRYVPIAGPELEFSDLIQEGNLAVLDALKAYDPDKGTWYSYAFFAITGKLKRAISQKKRTIRLPVGLVTEHRRLAEYRDMLWEDTGREPTDKEIADEAGTDIEKVKIFRDHLKMPASLEQDYPELREAQTDTDGIELEPRQTQALEELVMDQGQEDDFNSPPSLIDLPSAIRNAKLTEREIKVIRLRYGYEGEPLTQKDTGRELNVSSARVGQIEAKALAKLNQQLANTRLDSGPPGWLESIRRFDPAWAAPNQSS